MLIDFPTSRRNTSAHSGVGYYKSDFDDMVFSDGSYLSTKDKSGNITYTPHPDGDEVFGSLRDYYDEMSVGDYEITGKNSQAIIVNPADTNNTNLPEWLIMREEVSYYNNMTSYRFMDTLYKGAVSEYGSTEMSSYDVVCFVVAGEQITSGNLSPKARLNLYTVGEMKSSEFNHIGVHAHEFAHAGLGAHDEYEGDTDIDPLRYSLMSVGTHNGPSFKGSCPAPFAPIYRIEYDWITPTTITPNVTSQSITYSSPTPNFYKVAIPAYDEYFILEVRRGAGFDQYTPEQNGSNKVAGVLLWHFDPDDQYDWVELEWANNNSGTQDENNRFPYPMTGTQDFDDSSTPSSKLRNGTSSSIAIEDIDWIGILYTGYATVDVTDLPPATPSNFSLTESTDEHPYLEWDANTELDFDEYKVYRKIDYPVTPWTHIATTEDEFYKDSLVTTSYSHGEDFYYKITAVDINDNESAYSDEEMIEARLINKKGEKILENIPNEYALEANYPNPFNPTTVINYDLPNNDYVELFIYNSLGQKVHELVKGSQSAGSYSIQFDASHLPSGIYIYKLHSNNYQSSRKMVLAK